MRLSPLVLGLIATLSWHANANLKQQVAESMPELESLYLHLHQNPELSYKEEKTAGRLADEMRRLGYDVTENVGGFGVVGMLKNGDGPTVMIRADTDGLPIIEETGKSYASKVKVKDDAGNLVGVMHGCGHDIHMTSLIGTAKQLMANKEKWQGTLMLVAQPAEEVGGGAKAMLKEGLYTQFAKPDHVLGLHVSAAVPAGKVAIAPGYALANVDSVDIIVKGKGGHGAYPHTTIDPVVLASRIVLGLQTITSREISPLEPSVITVGSIHGGSKHNIISNEVKLQLTLRSYNPDVREQQIAAIKRLTAGIAKSAGLEDSLVPEVIVHESESIPSTYNNPELAKFVTSAIKQEIGAENVEQSQPVMAGEDFGLYGRTDDNVPITIFWLGGVNQAVFDAAQKSGEPLPSLHSSHFAPDYPIAIATGVRAMTNSALALFNQK
ncbi:amidohydrolase [Pseudoalteromonas sp. L23]|uniref:M20 metallopeptidase family protein n=1 Tax=unclassified Pseudoalteromonas TaxID=194690 RepID=UPI001EF0767A|nr:MULTISPECIES: amidohydrolase [unclassified Pseudoalteromonas]MCF7512121.1 amidohydrolase [Pseudoalteromonas sp. L7]MCF7524665.1 amidohydrolase [Pseudoalteromonas sp. L23]MCG7555824.1 amidohydrolase [Pseudoalteromonas sp. Of11M-6]MCX2766704.1 amidohydrolase [Pseudoalteromonas sp. B530]